MAEKCDRCNGGGQVRRSFDGPMLICSACHGRGILLPVRSVDGMWENDYKGSSTAKRLGAAMDEIVYKHHEGGHD